MVIKLLPPPTQVAHRARRKFRSSGKACIAIAIAATALAAPSCVDTDFEIPQSELYAREFIKKFGVSSPDHSYSMAQSARANIQLERPCSGTIEIFTDVPAADGCRQLASISFSGKSADVTFDVLAGTKQVYVRVLDEHNIARFAQKVSISDKVFRAAESSGEIMGAADASGINRSEMEYSAWRMKERAIEYFWNNRASIESYSEAKGSYDGEYVADLWGADKIRIPNLYYLDNLKHVTGHEFFWEELKPMFYQYTDFDGSTRQGAFAESVDHIDQYYLNPQGSLKLDPDVTFQVLEDGPVTMECIWRGTQYRDYFGYYYWPKDKELTPEELWNLPKFIFLTPEDITDTSSLTQRAEDQSVDHYKWDSEKSENVFDYTEEKWGDFVDLNGMGTASNPFWSKNPKLRGTKYSLAYYGDDYTAPASYDFPKDVNIGYFLLSRGEHIFFSDCELNYYLINKQYWGNNINKLPEPLDGPTARPFAAKYTYDKRTYVGFGDFSGDCDLNDIVFIAGNVFPTPEDITPPPVAEKEPSKWTLACEDLGNTDDFDFNDIVIDIEYVKGSGKLTLIPRAAGGVLDSDIYFDGEKILEIHDWLGVPAGRMTNTRPARDVDPATVRPHVIDVDPEWTMTQEKGGFADLFRIFTHKAGTSPNGNEGSWLESYTKLDGGSKGQVVVPQMLLLKEGWEWPIERTGIDIAYPNFKEWVRDNDKFDWDAQKKHQLVVNHR